MSEKPPIDFGTAGFKSAAERVRGERAERLEDSKRIIPYGVPYLDDYTCGILRNDFVILGALTGAGKTSMATGIAKRALKEGRRVHFFALEAEPNEIERRLKFRLIVEAVYKTVPTPAWAAGFDYLEWRIGKWDDFVQQYERIADETIARDYRNLVTYYRGRDFRAEDISRFFRAVQDQTDLIILDHLHYVDFDDETAETRAIRKIVMTIRDVALEIGIPVIVLAHLRKPKGHRTLLPQLDDFHGSSEITKRATVCIILAPAVDAPSDKAYLARTYIHVGKHRARGASHLVARHDFHLGAREYSGTYELGRISFKGDTYDVIEPKRIPRWAAHCRIKEASL